MRNILNLPAIALALSFCISDSSLASKRESDDEPHNSRLTKQEKLQNALSRVRHHNRAFREDVLRVQVPVSQPEESPNSFDDFFFPNDDVLMAAVEEAERIYGTPTRVQPASQQRETVFPLNLDDAAFEAAAAAWADTVDSPIKSAIKSAPSNQSIIHDATYAGPFDDTAFAQAAFAESDKVAITPDLRVHGCRYLSTPTEHQAHLLESIRKAQRSILITSWGCYANIRNHSELVLELESAASRHVKIYIYYCKGNEMESLSLCVHPYMPHFRNIQQHQLNIHAKVLMVDDAITVGSYDWLQDPTSKYHNSDNESLVLDAETYRAFKEELWAILRSYRALSHTPQHVASFESRFSQHQPKSLHFTNHSVTLLTTPQMQRNVFEAAFSEAKSRIIFTVFSVTKKQDLLSYFLPLQLLETYLRTGKSLTVVYNPSESLGCPIMLQNLKPLCRKYSQLSLLPASNIHQKTLIVDDNMYVMGSYNLLSSAETLFDAYNYMETSVVIYGAAARQLIKQFEKKHL